LVKCIADDAISWIYTPVNTGHINTDHRTVEPGIESLEGEVGTDQIVIDEEVEDEQVSISRGAFPTEIVQAPVERLTEGGEPSTPLHRAS